MASDILIVDDEADIRELVAGILEDEGYDVRKASNADQALSQIAVRCPGLIFLDIWIEGSRIDGLQLLQEINKNYQELPVVMISGHGNIETAVTAIKQGAYDFIEKPFKADRLVLVAKRALEQSALKREIRQLKQRSGEADTIIGQSSAASQLRQQIEKVAPTNARVLISGASGAGKELAARCLHQLSTRAENSFVVINAAAITPEKMEEALFGVEAIATEAGARRIGALEEAHGGTLFIDEIADFPKETQNKIMRVLVEQNFTRVGGSSPIHVDVRIVSSTSRNLQEEIAAGRFREDLYHRLAVVPIRVPSLSERREDIPVLVEYFIQQIALASGLPRRPIAADAMDVLQLHDWPGNIRQLRNNIERVMILAGGEAGEAITAEMLPSDVGASAPPLPNQAGGERLLTLAMREARELFEREYLIAQINRFAGNVSRTAEFIGMERSALHRKLKLLGINS